MCLGLPARIMARDGDDGWILLGDARMRVNLVMTPDSGVGDWVLVHAGFAIQSLSEADALETWQLIDALEHDAEEMAS